MNMGVQTSFMINVSYSLKTYSFIFIFHIHIYPRNGIGESYGTSALNLRRHLHSVFHVGWTNSGSHQQCTRIPFSTSSPTFVISCLFENSLSDRFEVLSHLVLICIFLIVMLKTLSFLHCMFLM